jgi:hypothetical protein
MQNDIILLSSDSDESNDFTAIKRRKSIPRCYSGFTNTNEDDCIILIDDNRFKENIFNSQPVTNFGKQFNNTNTTKIKVDKPFSRKTIANYVPMKTKDEDEIIFIEEVSPKQPRLVTSSQTLSPTSDKENQNKIYVNESVSKYLIINY